MNIMNNNYEVPNVPPSLYHQMRQEERALKNLKADALRYLKFYFLRNELER